MSDCWRVLLTLAGRDQTWTPDTLRGPRCTDIVSESLVSSYRHWGGLKGSWPARRIVLGAPSPRYRSRRFLNGVSPPRPVPTDHSPSPCKPRSRANACAMAGSDADAGRHGDAHRTKPQGPCGLTVHTGSPEDVLLFSGPVSLNRRRWHAIGDHASPRGLPTGTPAAVAGHSHAVPRGDGGVPVRGPVGAAHERRVFLISIS